MTASPSPEQSTSRGHDLLSEVLAERFPTAAAVRLEAQRPTPAPPLIDRGQTTVSVDTMRRDAQDAIRFQTRREAADARRIEARIAAARKLTTAARRKAAS